MTEIINDNVTISETINTKLGEYNLLREYIGGVDENGEIDTINAMGCYISLNETEKTAGSGAVEGLYNILNELGFEAVINEEVIYNSFPLVCRSVTVENFIDDNTTETITDTIKDYFR